MYMVAPAIDRLGIDAYSHGDECLHGLVRPGKNTVYPQAIGLAATFDPDLIHSMATAISDEARAQWNANNGRHIANVSDPLTLWSPVVNMARDPRWGARRRPMVRIPSSPAKWASPLSAGYREMIRATSR